MSASDVNQPRLRIEAWGDENSLPPVDRLARWTIAGERSALMRCRIDEGFVVPEHAHPEEQITMILEGRLEFTVEDPDSGSLTTTAGAGEVVIVPGGLKHGALALTDVVSVDVFTPIKRDLLPQPA